MKCLCPACSGKDIKLRYDYGFDFLDNDSAWINCNCGTCKESFLTLFVTDETTICPFCKSSDLGLYPEEKFDFVDNKLMYMLTKCYVCEKSFLTKFHATDIMVGE